MTGHIQNTPCENISFQAKHICLFLSVTTKNKWQCAQFSELMAFCRARQLDPFAACAAVLFLGSRARWCHPPFQASAALIYQGRGCKHQPHLPQQILLTLSHLQSLHWKKDWDVMRVPKGQFPSPITDLCWWRKLRKQISLQLGYF